MKRFDVSRDLLETLYIKQNLTTYQIAERLGFCQGTIWKRLKEYNIKTRFPWNGVDLTKRQLRQWYLNNGFSTWEIEKRFGYSRGTVHRKLKEFGLSTRNISLSHIRFPRKNFSGNVLEKAYLMGFRIGDLNISKRGSKSETIVVKCASTKQGQLSLFKRLFSKYGHVLQGSPTKDKKINIQANLNLSFSFLLDKKPSHYRWVFGNKKTFFAFLGGFSDAEGSFLIDNKGLAIFSIGNYDYELLSKIKERLSVFDTETPQISIHKRKGIRSNNGYISNGDYCILRCVRKKYLIKLIKYLKPFIQHPDKIKKIKILEKNIALRNNLYGDIKMN